jgi:hypothetical protein
LRSPSAYSRASSQVCRSTAKLPIRVDGHLSFPAVDPLGVLAAGHLERIGCAGNFIPCTVREGTFLSVTERPPIRLAEPGRISSVVTPPLASARLKPGSCGHTECSAQTSGVVGSVASLPSSCAGTLGEG